MSQKTINNVRRVVVVAVVVSSITLLCAGGNMTTTTETIQSGARQRQVERTLIRDADIEAAEKRKALIKKVSDANDLLDQLKIDVEQFSERMDTLLDSNDGRRIAHDPVYFSTYLNMQKVPVTTSTELDMKIDRASALLERAQIAEGESEAQYHPPEEIEQEVEGLLTWANDRRGRLDLYQDTLQEMIQSAPDPDLFSGRWPTLSHTLRRFRAQELFRQSEARALGTSLASKENEQTTVETQLLIELERVNAENTRQLEKSRADNDRANAEHRIELMQKDAYWKQQLNQTETKYEADIAAMKRDRDKARVALAKLQSEFRIWQDQTYSDIKLNEDRALLKSPEVQNLLAPFFAHAHSDPLKPLGNSIPAPMSLSAIKAIGALEDDDNSIGLNKLLGLGTHYFYKDRPRWRYPAPISRCTPAQRAEICRAQKLLIDHGHLMVSMGLLSE